VVGRSAELAALDGFLEAANEGFATLAFEGEAGIGKTTLWLEGRHRAEQRGAVVLWCRPVASEAKLSFAALADLLWPVDDEVFAALPVPQREALEVALLRAAPSGTPPSAHAVGAGLVSVVRRLAAQGSVVLAVDDAQWLDSPSRVAIEFCARRLERETVGLFYTTRSPGARLANREAGRPTWRRRVVLGPPSLAAIGRIIADRTGRVLARPLLVRVVQASGGNPFYALEIARLLIERGAEHAPWGSLPVPDDLRELAAARVWSLPGRSREALLLAAVLSAPDGGLVDVTLLAPAEEQGIVTVDGRGRVEFAHPLFAAAVCGSVPSALLREAHRRAASLVPEGEQAARHLALGSRGADAEVATRLDEAAELAVRRGAPDAAAELGELAIALTPPSDAGTRSERLLRAAQFHFEAGDLSRADALAGQANQQARDCPARARALRLSAHLHGRRSSFADAARLAAQALGIAGDDDRLGADMELELAYCGAFMGDCLGAAEHARAAARHAEACGDQGILGQALAGITMCELMAGQGLDRSRMERALAFPEAGARGPIVFSPVFIHGCLALHTGDLDTALEVLGRLRAEVIERGQEGAAPVLPIFLVWACILRGDMAGAVRFANDARDAASVLEDPSASASALVAGALVDAFEGRVDVARGDALKALESFEELQWVPGVVWCYWVLGFVELSLDNPGAVHTALGPLSERLLGPLPRPSLAREPGEVGVGDPSLFAFLAEEIEALVTLGDLAKAEMFLAPFEQSACDLDRPWALAAAARLRGVLDAATGDDKAASVAFDLALAAHDRVPMPFERGRTLLLAGQAYRRHKQRGRARWALEEALSIFECLGAPLWVDKARTELARLGGRAGDADALTETERRLAELAASGLSNREVAARAFVSVKTVEANLSRVYRKLGVRSRAALAPALAVANSSPG
jgi:DNA-binding CsgD family transcriptional regulator